MRVLKVLLFLAVLFTVCTAAVFSFLNWYRPKENKHAVALKKKITVVHDVDPCWNVSVAPEKIKEINSILDQHFYFIGKGKQCLAYVSYDGQYVIKFLLQKPLALKSRFDELPNIFPLTLFKEYKSDKCDVRKNELFQSFIISYHIAPEQTGMLYVHLNATDNLFKKPKIVDEKGNPIHIDPDTTQFVIQKRARLVKPTLIDLMHEGRVNEAKARVDQVLMLLYEAAKKGVMDIDTGLVRNNNIGFLPTRAIYVDTGKLRLVKREFSQKDFVKDLKRLEPLHKWLRTYYPELAEHYAAKRQSLIDSYGK